MKKLFRMILVVALVFSFVFPNVTNVTFAEENVEIIDNIDWTDSGLKNIKITLRKVTEKNRTIVTEPSIEIDYIVEETNDIIHFERIGNTGYHYVNGTLVTTMSFDNQNNTRAITVPDSIRNLGFAPASGFSNFYFAGYYTWEIKAFKEIIIKKLRSEADTLLLNAVIASLPGGFIRIAVQKVYTAVTQMYAFLTGEPDPTPYFDGIDFNAVTVLYGSHHGQCNILSWYGYKEFIMNSSKELVPSTGTTFAMNDDHSWDGNPEDYTQPSACRVLDDTYYAN